MVHVNICYRLDLEIMGSKIEFVTNTEKRYFQKVAKVDVRTQRTRGGNAHEEGSQVASSASEEVNDMFA